jgi:hypothetical protein
MKILCFACLLLAATGCGAASDAIDVVDEPHTATLHGTWTSETGLERPAKIEIVQSALSAKLIVALEGHACLAESTLEAKVSLDGVKTTADVGGMHLALDGEPGLAEILGNFENLANGPCAGQGGSLRVLR